MSQKPSTKTKQWQYLISLVLGVVISVTAIPKLNASLLKSSSEPQATIQALVQPNSSPNSSELTAAQVSAQLPSAAKIRTLPLKSHPRLLATEARFAEIKSQSATDPNTEKWYQKLGYEADYYVKDQELPKYEIPDGKRLLTMSKRVLRKVSTLALIYRLSGEQQYLDRAWQELETAAQFPDWNPSHFLDTAEMTNAFALAYDWLYNDLTSSQRDLIRSAIVSKGLKPALGQYLEQESWTVKENNWNQVCNGGIAMGALAVLDTDPELAGEILQYALKRLPKAMQHYAPDGAWAEGPGYWNYATTYNSLILAALNTSIGSDFNLAKIAGFAETGSFPIYMTSPLGIPFNFADGKERALYSPALFWLSDRFRQPAYSKYQQQYAKPEAMDLVWYKPQTDTKKSTILPLDKYFRDVEIASMRSAWDDPKGIYIGLKAGSNEVGHGNLDLGTFVLDALGVRWAVELGQDDYNLPGYFDQQDQRWDYYRTRAEGQNTLVINPSQNPDQNIEASTKIERFDSQPEGAFAIANLTPAYSLQAVQVKRGMALQKNRQQVLLQDEIKADTNVDAFWFMHTKADIEIAKNGKSAMLSQDGVRLWAELLDPQDLRFTIMEAKPLPTSPVANGQTENEGIKKLAIQSSQAKDTRIMVQFTPLAKGQNPPRRLFGFFRRLRVKSLAEW